MKRQHKIKVDYGMPDYYKTLKVPNISRKLFSDIIYDFHTELQTLIINDNLIYQFPHTRFELVLKKDLRKPRIVDGKLINNVPVDWKATNELWNSHPESKEKKLLVRVNNSHTSGYVFRIYFKKFRCNLKNRSLFKFRTTRLFKRSISKRIKDDSKDNLNAFLLY